MRAFIKRGWLPLLLAVVAGLVWYHLFTEKTESSNPFGEADAERVAREFAATLPSYQYAKVEVDVSGIRGGRWDVVVTRIPRQPGGNFFLELDQNGNVIHAQGGR